MKKPRSVVPISWAPVKQLLLTAAVGLFVLLVNFPNLTVRAVHGVAQDPPFQTALIAPIRALEHSIKELTPAPFFRKLMTANFLVEALFVATLVAFAARHRDASLVVFGIGGFVAGVVALHVLAWCFVAVGGVFAIVVWIYEAVGWVLGKIYNFFAFVFVHGWWLFVLAGVAGALYAARGYMTKALLVSGAAVVVGTGLYLTVPRLWTWLMEALQPLIAWLREAWTGQILPVLLFAWHLLLFLLKFFLVFVLALVVLASLGHLLIDQIRTTRCCASGHKHVSLAAFAIGTALALVLLTAVAADSVGVELEAGWTQSVSALNHLIGSEPGEWSVGAIHPAQLFGAALPSSVVEFVREFMAHAQAPLIDGLILLFVTVLATLGLLKSMPSPLANPPTRLLDFFVPRELLMVLMILLGAIFSSFLAGSAEATES